MSRLRLFLMYPSFISLQSMKDGWMMMDVLCLLKKTSPNAISIHTSSFWPVIKTHLAAQAQHHPALPAKYSGTLAWLCDNLSKSGATSCNHYTNLFFLEQLRSSHVFRHQDNQGATSWEAYLTSLACKWQKTPSRKYSLLGPLQFRYNECKRNPVKDISSILML